MKHARLVHLVGRFPGRRIVVAGDLVADEFVYGDIARVSREAPVLILEHRNTVAVPGGGGNAVANLHALDATPIPVGVVGRDAAGRRLLEHFRRARISVRGIRAEEGYETPAKSRVVAGGMHTRRQQVVRIDRGAAHGSLPRPAFARLLERLAAALPRAEALLVADYGYGAAPPSILSRSRRHAGLLVAVDSRARVGSFRRVTACTPNQEEVERTLESEPLARTAALESAGRSLLERTGDRAVLITRGAAGMSLFESGRRPLHVPAFGEGEVADVTGAGDTVIAVFTLALASGASFPEAAILANVAAGLVVMKAGTATVSRAEMLEALEHAKLP
jgi:rfaE bifunctional protein kinase chain/domain